MIVSGKGMRESLGDGTKTNCRGTGRIGKWNVRSLFQPGKNDKCDKRDEKNGDRNFGSIRNMVDRRRVFHNGIA